MMARFLRKDPDGVRQYEDEYEAKSNREEREFHFKWAVLAVAGALAIVCLVYGC
jgi:hypothetical protein